MKVTYDNKRYKKINGTEANTDFVYLWPIQMIAISTLNGKKLTGKNK